MHVVTQLMIFFVVRWLAYLFHAGRSTCFLLGWIAALLAYAFVDKFHLGKKGEPI